MKAVETHRQIYKVVKPFEDWAMQSKTKDVAYTANQTHRIIWLGPTHPLSSDLPHISAFEEASGWSSQRQR